MAFAPGEKAAMLERAERAKELQATLWGRTKSECSDEIQELFELAPQLADDIRRLLSDGQAPRPGKEGAK